MKSIFMMFAIYCYSSLSSITYSEFWRCEQISRRRHRIFKLRDIWHWFHHYRSYRKHSLTAAWLNLYIPLRKIDYMPNFFAYFSSPLSFGLILRSQTYGMRTYRETTNISYVLICPNQKLLLCIPSWYYTSYEILDSSWLSFESGLKRETSQDVFLFKTHLKDN